MRLKKGSLHGPATWWRSVSVLESASWMLRQVLVSIGGWKSTSTARAGTNGQPDMCILTGQSCKSYLAVSEMPVCLFLVKKTPLSEWFMHTLCVSSCRSSRVNEGWGHSLRDRGKPDRKKSAETSDHSSYLCTECGDTVKECFPWISPTCRVSIMDNLDEKSWPF